jgi:chromodomain-helicase-DNA-binding protein 1
VVVPLSTLSAWARELRKWAPSLDTVTYTGSALSRDLLRKHEFGKVQYLNETIYIYAFLLHYTTDLFLKS